MKIKCMECQKEYKRLNIFHLKMHGLTEKTYLEKHPEAKLYYDGYKENISKRTAEGMKKLEVRKKLMAHVESRDYSGKNNPFYGKTHSEERKKVMYTKERAKKISEKRKEWWSDKKGKTVEELYGENIGRKIRLTKSKKCSGKGNPAYGKVYERTGGHYKIGRYKGKLFRGLWEYSYLKFLEGQEGVELASVDYEPFYIEYYFKGKQRTYTPDFLVENQVVEIKPLYKKNAEITITKKEAAEKHCKEHGLTYEILTEKDFPVLTYAQAYADPDVEWIRK